MDCMESGKLKSNSQATITQVAGGDIEKKFSEIVIMRNRIIHGFRITSQNGEQILATKEKDAGRQFEIDEAYLERFIKMNAELSSMLHQYRGY